MYAIISHSGRQYTVREGDVLTVDYQENAEKGSTFDFDKVLAISGDSGLTLGAPTVEGASVSAEVLGPQRGPKLIVQKFRRRKNSRRKTGHRQVHTKVKIAKITV
jgi:large subunit ribosomal protein L21